MASKKTDTIIIPIQIDENGLNRVNENINETVQVTKSLKAQLREMTIELQGLEPGTQRFYELTAAAGQLKDQISDTNAVIKATAGSATENLAKGLGNVASVGIAGFQGMASAAALFGGESEAVQQSLLKLQALAGLSDAINSLGALGDTMTDIKASFMAAATQLGFFTVAKETDIVVTGVQTVATEGATVATKVLGTAMKALPIFAIIGGITAIVSLFSSYSERTAEIEQLEKKRVAATKAANEEQKKSIDFVTKESSEFVGLIYQIKSSNENSKERSNLIKQVNKEYGTTLKNLADETAFQAMLNASVTDYISLQFNKLKLSKNQQFFDEQLGARLDAETKLGKVQKEAIELAKSEGITIGEVYRNREDLREGQEKYTNAVEKANKNLESLGLRKEQLTKIDNDLTNGQTKYVVQQDKSNNSTKKTVEINDELIVKLRELTEEQYNRNNSEEDRLKRAKENADTEIQILYNKTAKTVEDTKNRDAALRLIDEKYIFDKAQMEIEQTNNYLNELKNLRTDANLSEKDELLNKYNEDKIALEKQLKDKVYTQEQYNILLAQIDANYLTNKESIEKKYADRESIAKFELNATTLEGKKLFLDAQMAIELENKELTESEKALIEEKYRKQKADLDEQERQANLKAAQDGLNIAAQGLNAFQGLSDAVFSNKKSKLEKGSKEEEALARKQFKINKTMQIGGAIIDSAKAVMASLASSPIAIGPVPNPAGIASLAFVATASMANIAKIASTQFGSSNSSSNQTSPNVPSAPTMTDTTSTSGPATPSFNLFGSGGQQNNVGPNGPNGSNQNITVTAVVSETDVTNVQNKVKGIKTSSEL
jgi:hypothetical protein